MRKVLVLGLALALFPSLAGAQPPSYAQNSTEEVIRGRIAAMPGTYDMVVRDDRGFDDNVRLHQGTIINPTGLTLAVGMTVRVYGYNEGKYFSANEIDTPYTYAGPLYYPYPYSYPGYYYPGYSWGLGWGWGWGGGWYRYRHW